MPPSAITQTRAVCDTVAASPSSTACISVPRTATMNAAIIVLEWPGSRPCSAPSRIALGMNSQALPPASRVWKSVMASEVFRDRLELADRVARAHALDGVLQAMVDVVVHQRLLGIGHGTLDRLHLLRDLEAV